jgi:hypothetical protein
VSGGEYGAHVVYTCMYIKMRPTEIIPGLPVNWYLLV